MANPTPYTCPHCGSSNSGPSFGFNPQRINNDETLIHDVLFVCGDCAGRWAAIGFSMIARRDGGEPSEEAVLALTEAVAAAGDLRIEALDE